MLMKVRKSSILFALAIFMSTGLFGLFFSFLAAPIASAAPVVSFAFDYDSSPQSVTSMLKAASDGKDDQAFKNSEIYAQGGLFGSGAEFTYQRYVDGGGPTGTSYQYSFNYSCVGGQPQLGAPPTNVNSYTVEASVFLDLHNDAPFNNKTGLGGTGTPYYITHVTFNGAQVQNQPIQSYPDAHDVGGISENDSALSTMHFPHSCVTDTTFTFGGKRSANAFTPITNLEAPGTPQNVKDNWAAIIAAAQAAGSGGTGSSGSTTNPEDACASSANGFGWLLCPAINLVNSIFADPFQQLILTQLKVDPLDTSGGGSTSNQQLFNTWDNLRTLANVLFVLVFIVIIFANTLQFNMNAYTIKKVIPKLVAAVILVQFSFVISALLIDFGNVLGDGVNGLIQTAVHGTGAGGNPSVPDVVKGAGIAIGGAVAIGVVAATSIVAVISLAITALFGFLAIFFTLVVRKLIIEVLIVMSPLAFVAFVLPGTERVFRLWYQNFIRVILMYPMIALLFAISGLLTAASGGTGWPQIIASAFPIIACFLVPMTFRLAGSFMKATGGFVNSRINKVGGKARSGWKDSGAAKSLGNRQTSMREAGLDRLDGRLNGWATSGSRLKRAAARTGFRAGAVAIGAPAATPLSRQRATSNLVNNFDKELKDLKQATSGNMKNALLTRFGDDTVKDKDGLTERAKAERNLRAAGAAGLLSYTKTHEGRQALMRRLADNDLTGVSLAKAIRTRGTDRDRQALTQENGKNLSSSLGVFGSFETDPATGLRTEGSGSALLRGTTASDIKQKFKTSSFDAATDPTDTQGQLFSEAFAHNMSEVDLEHTFDTSHRDSAGADKRAAILKMMARNPSHFATGRGRQLRDKVMREVKSGGNADAVALLSGSDKTALGL